jgi:hypothetical protein
MPDPAAAERSVPASAAVRRPAKSNARDLAARSARTGQLQQDNVNNKNKTTMDENPVACAVCDDPNWDLWVARSVTLGSVALAFPVAGLAVFDHGADRKGTADILAVVYSFGLFLGFTTSLWPLPSLREWTLSERLESLCLVFLVVSCITHLSWELVWLVAHEAIARSRDAAWAYPWWAYIDGGDMRYAKATPMLLMMETLSVFNGVVCATGLVLWYRSGSSHQHQLHSTVAASGSGSDACGWCDDPRQVKCSCGLQWTLPLPQRKERTRRDSPTAHNERDPLAVLLFMATAVVHLYSTSLYYGSELIAGLPNVNKLSFLDTWVKFGLANASWIVFPPCVLAWGAGLLLRRRDDC